MLIRKRVGEDPFDVNKDAIIKENAFLLKRLNFCVLINMSIMCVLSHFLPAFSSSRLLYIICAALSAAFAVYCRFSLDKHPKAVAPLFYVMLGTLCAYSVCLSSFIYRDIHGVTIIGIFVLVPLLFIDRTFRLYSIISAFYAAGCAAAFINKPYSLAVDDCLTGGTFMLFGMLIGVYLRRIRISAINQTRLLELQRDIDPLMGIPNRRTLFETLSRIDGNNDTSALGVVMIDIDRFKEYNDFNGHQAGDDYLRQLGSLFSELQKEWNITVYRYGGEEFLALDLSGDNAAAFALSVAERVAERNIRLDNVTVSAGYAVRRAGESTNSEKLISMADEALYEAKRQGRNRVLSYEQIPHRKRSPRTTHKDA